MGTLDGVRVLEAGLLVQGPQAALTMLEWGADVVKVELPGFGDQGRWLPISRERPALGLVHRLQPRQAQRDGRPARSRGPRGLPPPGRTGRRRHHQLQARDDGGLGPRVRRRRPRATRGSSTPRARRSAPRGPTRHAKAPTSARRRPEGSSARRAGGAATPAPSAPPSPTTSPARTFSPASWPRCTHASARATASWSRPRCSGARSGPRPASTPATSCPARCRGRVGAATR